MPRLVVLGGSGASTPELADALAGWPGGPARRPSLTVVLQGRSADKLALVVDAFRERLAADTGTPIGVETATDLGAALQGRAVRDAHSASDTSSSCRSGSRRLCCAPVACWRRDRQR